MQLSESEKRQEKLKKYLCEMAASPMKEAQLTDMAENLKTIYSDDFRHRYSDFFSLIIEIDKNKSYNLEYLSTNLNSLQELIESRELNGESGSDGIFDSVIKSSDHINLEIARYTFYLQRDKKIADLKKQGASLQKELANARDELNNAQRLCIKERKLK